MKIAKYILVIIPIIARAQFVDIPSVKSEEKLETQNFFSDLIFTSIPGAPALSNPQLLRGSAAPLMGEGMGWAAPAVWDWNNDGKKDLLIGEFGSGCDKMGEIIGNFVRVYLNQGTDSEPKFSDNFTYAKPPFGIGNGTPLSISTWCCLPFRPQFFDLDSDGYKDMITGQYNPGVITWFRGSKNGFLPGEPLPQESAPQPGSRESNDSLLPITNTNSMWYWNFSSASFGDFDADGDFDLVVGGSALRISKNVGTKEHPRFAHREFLLDTNGQPLTLYKPSEEELELSREYKNSPVGLYSSTPIVVDWDQDNTLDLLVTNGYYKKGYPAVIFFRGLKVNGEYRFEEGVPIFKSKTEGKEFPGSWLNPFVTDWNNDGINDLLLGTSVATINNEMDSMLTWSWEEETEIIKKNPAIYDEDFKKMISQQIINAERNEKEMGRYEMAKRHYMTKEEVITNYFGKTDNRSLMHKGYVYLILGSKSEK